MDLKLQIKKTEARIRRLKKELKATKKDVNNIKRFKDKNPLKKELCVPYMGSVTIANAISQGKRRIVQDKQDIDRHKEQLKRWKKSK